MFPRMVIRPMYFSAIATYQRGGEIGKHYLKLGIATQTNLHFIKQDCVCPNVIWLWSFPTMRGLLLKKSLSDGFSPVGASPYFSLLLHGVTDSEVICVSIIYKEHGFDKKIQSMLQPKLHPFKFYWLQWDDYRCLGKAVATPSPPPQNIFSENMVIQKALPSLWNGFKCLL